MPKIPIKNPRYRTKDQLCADLALIVNSELQYGTKYAVLSEATWVWTEFEGKYVGCEHWSEAAWRIRDQRKMLVHEHVIPKSIIIQRLIALAPKATAGSVNELLTTYCKGAVITKEEDNRLNTKGLRSKMPAGWDETDVWARYTQAAINIRETEQTGAHPH